MGRISHWIIPFITLCLLVSVCRAQTSPVDSTDKVKNALINYYKTYPREKIFIHTNAQVYTPGQTIWYKVYSSAYGKPSAISKIVYVQLTDSAGHIITQNKLPLADGFSHGNIDLSQKLPSGWYQLRGFTAWMMNFPTDNFFSSKIYVGQVGDAVNATEPVEKAQKYTIKFYPEGGDLIDGNEGVIAFKATGMNNLPTSVYDTVIDDTRQKIADITTIHDGMGQFSIAGNAGRVYKAVVHFPDSSIQTVTLPTFKSEGVEMRINNHGADNINMKLSYTGSRDKYSRLLLVAFQDNGVVVTYPIKLNHGTNVFSINKKLFTTGIVRLSIFGSNNVPLAERIVFVNNRDLADIKLNANALSFGAKGKNSIDIQAVTADGTAIQGNFSVSVRDYKAAGEEEAFADNICSSFLVSSELRGSLYHPGYYFQSNADSLQDQLDLVMLTNGWRHFSWDTLLNAKPAKLQYAPERSQYIAGQIISKDKITGEKIKLIILNQDSSKYIGLITPDSLGRFILRDYEHAGVSQLYVEMVDSKNHIKKATVKLLNTFADSLKNQAPQPFTADRQVPKNIVSSLGTDNAFDATHGKLLQTVVIKGKKLTPTDEEVNEHVSPLYRSIQEYTLDLVNHPAPDISIFDYIKGRFPGLRIIDTGGTTLSHMAFIYLTTSTFRKVGTTEPYFYLNESPATYDEIKYINLHDVALIRFLPPPVVFAPFNGGNIGAIMIYTRNNIDDRKNMASDEVFDKYTFDGYTITREFSSPDYSIPANKNIADNRSTLYWQPELKTNTNGEARFSFYNSDNTNGYVIIIQGMDRDGHTGYLYKIIHK
jgi:hypothetical protein